MEESVEDEIQFRDRRDELSALRRWKNWNIISEKGLTIVSDAEFTRTRTF
jgi:hypothetical protein